MVDYYPLCPKLFTGNTVTKVIWFSHIDSRSIPGFSGKKKKQERGLIIVKFLCLPNLETHQCVEVHQLRNQHGTVGNFYFKKFKTSFTLEVGGLCGVITL